MSLVSIIAIAVILWCAARTQHDLRAIMALEKPPMCWQHWLGVGWFAVRVGIIPWHREQRGERLGRELADRSSACPRCRAKEDEADGRV